MIFFKKHWWKVILIICSPFIFLLSVFGISQLAPNKPPKDFLIVHNMFDFDQIIGFSRFRSCQGHRSMSQGTKEPDSSMAHYITTTAEFKSPSQGTVKVYAPFDGYITNTLNFQGFSFVAKSSPFPWWPFNQYRINLAHVKALPKYQGTVPVKAGDWVGTDDPREFYADTPYISLDVRIGVLALPPEKKANNGEPLKNMDSMFRYLSDKVFSEYQAVIPGLKSREDFVIPVSWRAENPCILNGKGPYFDYSYGDSDDPRYSAYVLLGNRNIDEMKQKKTCANPNPSTGKCD